MRRLALAAAVGALGIAAAGCGGGSNDSEDGNPPPAPPPVAAPAPPPPEPPPSVAAPAPPPPEPPPVKPKPKPASTATVRIVVRGGKPVGGLKRVTLKKGQRVTLVVRSDVADEVHLHGYDRSVDVDSGQTARLVFTASIPGRFEVELEDRGLQIADLEVRP
jgi:hypothetical protein